MTGPRGGKRPVEEVPAESTPSKKFCPCGQNRGSHQRVLIDTTTADGEIREDTPVNSCLVIVNDIFDPRDDEERRDGREIYVKKFFQVTNSNPRSIYHGAFTQSPTIHERLTLSYLSFHANI